MNTEKYKPCLAMEFLRNEYIPFIVKEVIKEGRPKTDDELIKFFQRLYDKIKHKERELDVLNIKN